MSLRELATLMAERQLSSVPIVARTNGQVVLGAMALDAYTASVVKARSRRDAARPRAPTVESL